MGSWSTHWLVSGTDLVDPESESNKWSLEEDGGEVKGVSLDVEVILQ